MLAPGVNLPSLTLFVGVLVNLLSLSCSQPAREQPASVPANRGDAVAELKSPDRSWERRYFERINERARTAELGDLRATALAGDDLEVRVWVGFALVPLEGVVIKRRGGAWSATHVRSISPHIKPREYQRALPPPKSGWENFWQQLNEMNISTLPDDSQFREKVFATDGESFVVETNVNGSYRTYKYSNPRLQKWPEAKQMLKAANYIFDEFGIDRSF